MEQLGPPTERIIIKLDIWVFFENLSRKSKFRQNLTRITGTLHEDIRTFIIPRWILGMRIFSEESCRENQCTQFMYNNFSSKKSCRLWDNVEKYGRVHSEPGGTRWRTGGEVRGKLANGVGRQYSHATSERGLSSITQADAHNSAASSRLNWRPHRFKWTRPFRGKKKSGFCACAITFRTSYTAGQATNTHSEYVNT